MGRKGVWGAMHTLTNHPQLAPSSYDISQPAGRHLPYNFGISRSSLRLAMEGLVASSAPINATPVIVATSASTDATVTTVCDWQVAPILHIRPGARRRRERDAFRHRDCTVIIHTYAACVQNHRQPHAYSDGRASRCPHVIREHRASSAGEVMCGRSANVLHISHMWFIRSVCA